MDLTRRCFIIFILTLIADPLTTRNSSLTELSLKSGILNFTKPVSVSTINLDRSLFDRQELITFGRLLSDGERGCFLAHKQNLHAAYLEMVDNPGKFTHLDWVIVLEDDADVSQPKLLEIQTELSEFSVNVPALVSYCVSDRLQPVFSIRRMKSPRKVVFPRPGTVAFAINFRGLEKLNENGFFSSNSFFVADFPPQFSDLSFFISKISVTEIVSPSTIGSRNKVRLIRRVSIHINQVFNLSLLSQYYSVSKLTILKWLVLYPFLRDLSVRAKKWLQH